MTFIVYNSQRHHLKEFKLSCLKTKQKNLNGIQKIERYLNNPKDGRKGERKKQKQNKTKPEPQKTKSKMEDLNPTTFTFTLNCRQFQHQSKHQRLQDCRKARPNYILCIKDALYIDWDGENGALTDGAGREG